MKTIKDIYQIGPGPSSSHTLGPQKAAKKFKELYPDATSYEAHLYGSLSLTGKGHLTDYIIKKVFEPKECKIEWHDEYDDEHPNVFYLFAHYPNETKQMKVMSVGGGAVKLKCDDLIEEEVVDQEIYKEINFDAIKDVCLKNNYRILDYINEHEDLDEYLGNIFDQMLKTVDNGLKHEGLLPGALKLERCAKKLYHNALELEGEQKDKLLISAYAYAASEENASGGTTVTAPTLGSSGVFPAIMYYLYNHRHINRQLLIDSLKIGGLFGNIIKQNATISGAKGGCQAEIGAACSMASAAIAFICGCNDHAIEYAAEMGMEHFLGLTCDPVGGYVMIPCIERNAVAALRAFDSALLTEQLLRVKNNKVSFDMVVNAMNYTGNKLVVELKETSLGGLATIVPVDENK